MSPALFLIFWFNKYIGMVLTRRKYTGIRRKRVTKKRVRVGKMRGGSSAPTLKQVKLGALLMTINRLINNKNIADTELAEQFNDARSYLGDGTVSTMLPVNTDTLEKRNAKLDALKSRVENAIKNPSISANNKGQNIRKSSGNKASLNFKRNTGNLTERRASQNNGLMEISPNNNNSSSRKSSQRVSMLDSLEILSKRKQTESDVAKIISDLINGIDPNNVDELKNNVADKPYFPITSDLKSISAGTQMFNKAKLVKDTLTRRKEILIKYLTTDDLTDYEKGVLYLTVAEKKYIKGLITDSALGSRSKFTKTQIIDKLNIASKTGLPPRHMRYAGQ